MRILEAGPGSARRREGAWDTENTVRRVIEVFERLEAGWGLVGAHAVSIFTEPRATVGFDFVVDQPWIVT